MELKNWVIQHVKAKNAIRRTLEETKDNGDEITFTHKHKVHHFKVSPELASVTAKDFYTVACHDTDANLQFLIDNWEEFLQPNLCVLFVNDETGETWQVCPKTHAMIADEKNLAQGLKSLAGRS